MSMRQPFRTIAGRLPTSEESNTSQLEPSSPDEIVDRRNELSGNKSLNQKLGFTDHINDSMEDETLSEGPFSHQGHLSYRNG